MVLSERQKEVLRHAQSDLTSVFAGGAVRSGKSFSVLMSFAIWLVDQEESYDHAVVGQSIESILRNMGFDFVEYLNKIHGVNAYIDKSYGTRIVVHAKALQSVWIIGANDAKARRRIQGCTLKGLVVEELALLPENFFQISWSRLSVDGAKLWASYNPEGPSHWAKKNVIDFPERYRGKNIRFKMSDNPILGADVIERYEKSFTGHFYKRLIEGKWAAAQGACYTEWALTDDHKIRGGRWSMAMDWAASGTLAALAIHHLGRQAIVGYEYYHTGRQDGLLTEKQAVDNIVAWFRSKTKQTGAMAWIDPSSPPSVKRLLRENYFLVRGADNDIIPGIITTAARLSSHDVKINRKCKDLQDELSGYVWDDVAADQGIDKPVKKADHGCDALRYWAHSTGKAYFSMKDTPVLKALPMSH